LGVWATVDEENNWKLRVDFPIFGDYRSIYIQHLDRLDLINDVTYNVILFHELVLSNYQTIFYFRNKRVNGFPGRSTWGGTGGSVFRVRPFPQSRFYDIQQQVRIKFQLLSFRVVEHALRTHDQRV
jgi:hypothetical protein